MVVTIQFPHRRIPNQLNSIAFGSIIAFCTRCVTVNRPLRESEKASTTDARFINDSLKRARVRLLMFVELIPHIFANSLKVRLIFSEVKPYLLKAMMIPSQHLKSVDIDSLTPVILMSS